MDILLYFLTFIGGILSIFSPCVLSLLPIYMSYLSFGAKSVKDDGTIVYNKNKVMTQTLFFIFGICTTFFILGFSVNFLGSYLLKNNKYIQIIGGGLIVILGLFQLEIFNILFLKNEKRINFSNMRCNPFLAYITGFVFSFAWTPCVGPSLTTVLILVAGNNSKFQGFILISLYALGFVLPFILLGAFTSEVLKLLKQYRSFFKYVTKISGVILVIIGIALAIKGVTLNNSASLEKIQLKDQYSNIHTIKNSNDKKTVYIFLSTWCSICKSEMKDIGDIFNSNNYNIVGVMNPKTADSPFAVDEEISFVLNYIKSNGYSFPILLDNSGALFNKYQIKAFPTTIFVDENGNLIEKYVGGMGKDKLTEKLKNFFN